MTQIRSLAQPVHRRPGELGVHSLDLFNFLVPDAAAAEKFYRSFGLDVREEQGKLNIYTQGHPHRWGSLVEGPRKKLNFISFGAFEDDLPRFRERLQNMRIDLRDPPVGFESNGLWFRDADGTLLEIRVAEKSSPNEKSAVSNPPGPAAKANAPSRSKAFFDGIDPSMEYAAMIDGCSRWGAFWRVAMPTAVPGLTALAILCWLYTWNEFLFALILTSHETPILTVVMAQFVHELGMEWNLMSATAVIALVPALIVTLFGQRYVIRGLRI